MRSPPGTRQTHYIYICINIYIYIYIIRMPRVCGHVEMCSPLGTRQTHACHVSIKIVYIKAHAKAYALA
jgi:hypothetical protein